MNVRVNGINLFYARSGSGPPLVLLHGSGETHHIFDPLCQKLSPHFTVYAPDSRNHGDSEQTGVYDYSVMAKDILAFFSVLKLKRVSLLGFSDGAIVSLLCALRHPGGIRRMALLGVNLKPEDFTREALCLLRREAETTGSPLARMMLEQPQIDIRDLHGLRIPSLIVAGENDVFYPETFRNIAAAIPGARLLTVAGHDHASYVVSGLLAPELLRFFLPETP